MKRFFLIFALICIVGGGIMVSACLGPQGWDFTKLDTEQIDEMSYTTAGADFSAAEVTTLRVKIHTTRLAVRKEGDEFSLQYYESKFCKMNRSFEEGVLSFEESTKWYRFFGLFSGWKRSRLTTELVIPADFSGILELHCTNGDLNIADAQYETLTLDVTNGELRLDNVQAKRCTAKSVNGSVRASGVTADELKLSSVNGELSARNCSLGRLTLDTTNGELEISDSTVRVLDADCVNGDISVLNTAAVEVALDTVNGALTLRLKGVREDYRIDGSNAWHKFAGNQEGNGSGKSLVLRTVNGEITVEFI